VTSARGPTLFAIAVALLITLPQPARALPTMIRLGYSDCAACHISPQGAGLLNLYGRGIDRAQSLRGGEYVPQDDDFAGVLTFGGRTTQDLRLVLQEHASWPVSDSMTRRFWPRLMYRNVTALGKGFRVSGAITGATESVTRPSLSYDPPSTSSLIFVNTALLNYRANQKLEFSVGRDQLPSGLNVPDLGVWIKSRNRFGYYDAPNQVKMFWSGQHVHVAPYVYESSSNEVEHERGAGTLAEFVLGSRAVLGTTFQNANAVTGGRQTVGGYARLGFGRWGILAEHDVTRRTREESVPATFAQQTTYGQVFWAMREWFVVSAIGERLFVEEPFLERMLAGKLELATRLASEATISISAQIQHDQISGRTAPSVILQAAFKTVP
jgi:hypothetical protein